MKSPRDLMDLYYKSVGRGGSFLLNVPPDRRGLLHENDVASLRGFGDMLRSTFKQNLAAKAKLTASNVRGKDAAFAPRNLLDGKRNTSWITDDNITTPELVVDMQRPATFNVIALREDISLGQRVEAVALDLWKDGKWEQFAEATSIGSHRLIRTKENVTTSRVRLRVTKSPVCPALSELGLYLES